MRMCGCVRFSVCDSNFPAIAPKVGTRSTIDIGFSCFDFSLTLTLISVDFRSPIPTFIHPFGIATHDNILGAVHETIAHEL